jgi:molecular chaperone DnaK (HSP70)
MSDNSLIKQVLNCSGLDKSEIDQILIVGPKPNPKFLTFIKEFFSNSKLIISDDMSYTQGAAILGGKLSSYVCKVAPLTLGI